MRITSRLFAPVALALICLLAQPARAAPQEGGYALDLTIDALCPQGEFPVAIQATTGALEGTLSLTLLETGRVTGSLAIDGVEHAVTGKHTVRRRGQTLTVKGGQGRKRFKFSGRVEDGVATGRFRDGGTVLRGRRAATVDLRGADSMSVAFDVSLAPDVGRWFRGSGLGAVCSDAFVVDADLREGRRGDKLRVDGPSLRWRCRGAVTGDAFETSTWTLRGHGIRLSGKTTTLSFAPPSPPRENPDVLLITVSGHPFPLPPATAYLGGELGPALVAEIESAGFTAAEDDFVDAPTTTEGDGLAGLLDRMEWVRDNWVEGVAVPTAVIVVAHSHGGVWAHEAIRLVPDLPIAGLVDLDTNSCAWSLVHPGEGLDPVGAYVVGASVFDLEDIVWPHVDLALEVWSDDPIPCFDVSEPGPYDDAANIRSDGTSTGLFFHASADDHTGVRQTTGDTYPVLLDFLLDVLSGR